MDLNTQEIYTIGKVEQQKIAKNIERMLKDKRSQSRGIQELVFLTDDEIIKNMKNLNHFNKVFNGDTELIKACMIISMPYIKEKGIDIVEKDGVIFYYKNKYGN